MFHPTIPLICSQGAAPAAWWWRWHWRDNGWPLGPGQQAPCWPHCTLCTLQGHFRLQCNTLGLRCTYLFSQRTKDQNSILETLAPPHGLGLWVWEVRDDDSHNLHLNNNRHFPLFCCSDHNLTKLSNAMAGNNGGLDQSKTLDLCATEKVCVPSDSLCGVCK